MVFHRLYLSSNTVSGAFPNDLVVLNKSQLVRALAVSNRRTILIATMEYDIEDWNIKIKIGGLGVIA